MDRADIDKFVDRLAENSAQVKQVNARHDYQRAELHEERMAIVAEAERAGLVGVLLENIAAARQHLDGLYRRVVAQDSELV